MNSIEGTSLQVLSAEEIDLVSGAGFWGDVGMGAAGGAATGAVYGTIFGGPGGTVAGAIAGAIGGAIGAGASSLWG